MKGKNTKGKRNFTDKFVINMIIFYVIWCLVWIINDFIFSRISFIWVTLFISIAAFWGVVIIYLIYVVIKESRGLS